MQLRADIDLPTSKGRRRMSATAELVRLESEVAAAMSAWQSAEGVERVRAWHLVEAMGSLAADARKREMVAKILSEEHRC
jgi:hypothetical protein